MRHAFRGSEIWCNLDHILHKAHCILRLTPSIVLIVPASKVCRSDMPYDFRPCRQRKPKQYEDMMLGEGMDGDFIHNKAGQRSNADR